MRPAIMVFALLRHAFMTDPYHLIAATSETPLFLFGDHASRHIPERYENLGLTGEDLTRHIAWDIGSEDVLRGLCSRFGCGGMVAGFSQNLDAEGRKERIDTLYSPYHAALSTQLNAQTKSLVVSVHSFTPKPDLGEKRTVDMGLLVKHDESTAQAFKDAIYRLAPKLSVGMNEPYSAYDLNHTIDFHVAPRALPHLAIEIRQDHIRHKQGVTIDGLKQ